MPFHLAPPALNDVVTVPHGLRHHFDHFPAVPPARLAAVLGEMCNSRLDPTNAWVAWVLCELAEPIASAATRKPSADEIEATAMAITDRVPGAELVAAVEALGLGRERITCEARSVEQELRRLLWITVAGLLNSAHPLKRERPRRE